MGQTYLMRAYEELFAWHDIVVAQTLLTRRDLADRQGYLNARNTLLALLEVRAVPIVNENDVVAVDEIEGAKIGDNDNLSALVANLVDADLLVLLTDTAGLFTADPHRDPQAQLIPRVERIDRKIEALAGGSGDSRRGRHGDEGAGRPPGHRRRHQMSSSPTATGANILTRLAQGEEVGTFFPATADRMESRKRWMLSGLSLKGSVAVDAGAAQALRQENRSLSARGRALGGWAPSSGATSSPSATARGGASPAASPTTARRTSRPSAASARTASRRRWATSTGPRWCTATTWCCFSE